jgi:hypothetical protein
MIHINVVRQEIADFYDKTGKTRKSSCFTSRNVRRDINAGRGNAREPLRNIEVCIDYIDP